jgi:hypothetical protein
VTQPELAAAVLRQVSEFLRDLPSDQLAALAHGTARLTVTPAVAPARPAVVASARPPRLPVTADEVRVALSACPNRAAAVRYLDDLRLNAPQLRALARDLGLAVASAAAKSAVRDTIVQWTVGRRVDAAILSRPGLLA